MKKTIYFLIGIAVLAVACEDNDALVVTDQPVSLCDSIDILYSNGVKPLLADAGCSEGF